MDFLCDEKEAFIEPSIIVKKYLHKKGITREQIGLHNTVIFTFIEDMRKLLLEKLNVKEEAGKIFRSPFFNAPEDWPPFSIIGDPVGAPQAVILMEQIIGFGVQKIIFLGLCGGLQEHTRIGDIVAPTYAHREEGTSFHYLPPEDIPRANLELLAGIEEGAARTGISILKGPIWTTDAIYRETRNKINRYRNLGVLAVDMETSAVYAVAQFRAIKAAAALVVSDESTGQEWKPGFSAPHFLEANHRACHLVLEAVKKIAGQQAP